MENKTINPLLIADAPAQIVTEEVAPSAADLLAQLEELQAAKTLIESTYASEVETIMAQVREQLDALQVEFQPKMTEVKTKIDALEPTVRAAIVAGGKSVKGALLHAVYVPASVTCAFGRVTP